MPRWLQLVLRRKLICRRIRTHSEIWPIDPKAASPPANWSGWPGDKRFAVILVHDVDTRKGYLKCAELMEVEKELGFCSSFNFVPERCYSLSPELRRKLRENGFEVGVHDLKHDGKLFKSEKNFRQRVAKINEYLNEWDSVGFRAGSMFCNLDWIQNLNIEYDSSTFDTDPFEPKPDGRRTIFPFWVQSSNASGYVELPYTMPQDFTLFILMKEKNIDIWKRKVDWIVANGGMVLITTHPDYIGFNGSKLGREEYPVDFYREILLYLKNSYQNQYWNALPRDVASFWSQNYKTNLPEPVGLERRIAL